MFLLGCWFWDSDFYLFSWGQLPLLPCSAIRSFSRLGSNSQVQVKVGCGESELFGDALEQGSEVGELAMSFLASFCQAKEGRGLK